ncbi:hypothetical protein [Halobacillus amylolyticus]|uniref:Uncharacterized protein n=1 Tax=Halobacillus amylolyticus TaxID=2932259 RepID=A0ABY4H6Y3_9BACI|nr:hypothetical protein [Halobacillus amylolyticus]UOR10339.1 hypothetical protein MUO15_11565 [Halobacillus amylolyticus]
MLMHIFTGDPAVIESGSHAIRIMFAMSILIGVQVVSGILYQVLGMAKPEPFHGASSSIPYSARIDSP